MDLSPAEFEHLRKLVHELCGILVPDEKTYLIQQRLMPVAKEAGCESFAAFIKTLPTLNSDHMRSRVVEAITTNETSWFRDKHPWEALREEVLPVLFERVLERRLRVGAQSQGGRVRIWSCAASTGQEAYSLAILIRSLLKSYQSKGLNLDHVEILATDISSEVLARAVRGRYTTLEVNRGLDAPVRDEFFLETSEGWELQESIRDMVEFKRLNLMQPFHALGTFDLILCRNVMIYFDEDLRRQIVGQFHQMLNPEGLLLLGAAESLFCVSDAFQSVRLGKSMFYRKREANTGPGLSATWPGTSNGKDRR